MALARIDHVPETVKLNLPLYLILPDPGKMAGEAIAKRKVLHLLHGLSDDGSAWQRYTYIETLAAARREDTLIAGNSMAGYGAFRAAQLRPELYAAAASFSGVLSLAVLRLLPGTDPRRDEFTLLFGDLERLVGGENDPAVWLERAARDPFRLPRLFISVSRQEDVYPLRGMFRTACQSLGVASEYHEEDGAHDWFFWDGQMRRFLTAVLGSVPAT